MRLATRLRNLFPRIAPVPQGQLSDRLTDHAGVLLAMTSGSFVRALWVLCTSQARLCLIDSDLRQAAWTVGYWEAFAANKADVLIYAKSVVRAEVSGRVMILHPSDTIAFTIHQGHRGVVEFQREGAGTH